MGGQRRENIAAGRDGCLSREVGSEPAELPLRGSGGPAPRHGCRRRGGRYPRGGRGAPRSNRSSPPPEMALSASRFRNAAAALRIAAGLGRETPPTGMTQAGPQASRMASAPAMSRRSTVTSARARIGRSAKPRMASTRNERPALSRESATSSGEPSGPRHQNQTLVRMRIDEGHRLERGGQAEPEFSRGVQIERLPPSRMKAMISATARCDSNSAATSSTRSIKVPSWAKSRR